MPPELSGWQYLPTLLQLVLALAIGLFVGIERERRQKEAGLRTFAFVAVLGATGGMLGEAFALLALGLVGVLIVLLNLETIRTGEGAEITTSAALAVTGFAGVLVGMGHTFTPTALGVVTAALLAWKQPLTGFSRALTEGELRSAILFAILAFIVYPVLPTGTVDPWGLIEPRAAWVTVILVAALGFANYILLRLYGARGVELTGFLGGLINSTVTVTALSDQASEASGRMLDVTFRGVVLATGAMLVRNAIILGLIAPSALLSAAPTLVLMLAGRRRRHLGATHAYGRQRRRHHEDVLALLSHRGAQVRSDLPRAPGGRHARTARLRTDRFLHRLRRGRPGVECRGSGLRRKPGGDRETWIPPWRAPARSSPRSRAPRSTCRWSCVSAGRRR